MENSKIFDVGTKGTEHNESDNENDTNEQDNSSSIQKDEEFEGKFQNEIIVTEMKDKNNWAKTIKSSIHKKDTIINIGVSETGSIAYRMRRKKTRLWSLHPRRMFTMLLRRQNYQKKEHLQEGLQGYPKQKVIVMPEQIGFQASEGAPLNYDPESRNSFVLLVMLIVLVMLLFTIAFIATVLATPSLKDFFQRFSMFIFIAATIALLACTYTMMCSACGRQPPCSFIILVITTVSMSALAALISSYYRTEIILYAAIATAAIVLVCAGLACTSFDFTKWLLYVIVIGVAFSVLAMVTLIGMKVTGHYIKPVHLGILVVSVLIQSVVLVIQLQMILGGGAVELSEDDYALGAFMLYTSIVDMFIKMVQILGLLDMD